MLKKLKCWSHIQHRGAADVGTSLEPSPEALPGPPQLQTPPQGRSVLPRAQGPSLLMGSTQ